MNKLPLRVLVVDDSEDDTLLLERTLRQGEWEISLSRVDGYDTMKQALNHQTWDVVVSDFMMPSFGGMQSLALFNSFHLNIPFILTSGKISEEMAVEALREGAQDFVLKQNTARLLPTIKRGIERARIIDEQRQAQEALAQSEALFRTLAAVAPIGILRTDAQGKLLYRNDTWRNMHGNLEQDTDSIFVLLNYVHREDKAKLESSLRAFLNNPTTHMPEELRLQKADGTIIWILLQVSAIIEHDILIGFMGVATDINLEKQREMRLTRQKELYQALSSTNQAIVYAKTSEDLFNRICKIAVNLGKFRFAWIGTSENNQIINRQASSGVTEAYLRDLDTLLAEKGTLLLQRLVVDTELIINDITEPKAELSISNELAKAHGILSFANFYIGNGDNIQGIMTFCSEHQHFFDDDLIELLREMRGDINFALKNFDQTIWRKQAQTTLDSNAKHISALLIDTVTAIANTIEMRDPYTAGHQKRVALLACAIAQKMGLDAERIEGLNLAAQIHDVGKINIPAEILNKPTRLTDIEFMLIKTHPESGYEILKDIEFPWPVATIVRQHHEKLDGSGYPLNLKQDDILLESRILAVADIVEAMASHRPYRPSLGLEVALAEIIRLADANQLDKTTVIACISVFKDDNYQLLA